MLRDWVTHEAYQKRLIEKLVLLSETEKSWVVSMDKLRSKLYLLNLDNLLPAIKLFIPTPAVPLRTNKVSFDHTY